MFVNCNNLLQTLCLDDISITTGKKPISNGYDKTVHVAFKIPGHLKIDTSALSQLQIVKKY